MIEDFHKISYKLHSKYSDITDKRKNIQETWLENDRVDSWRHLHMINPVIPLLKHYKGAKIVTIGDGKFGLDAINLKKHEPSLNILPTDISPTLLAEAKERGIITDYRIENAENLSFSDKEFDFTFCKSSFHHFPRPYIALYEMLRVSKNGIILIEPNDKLPEKPGLALFNNVRNIIKKLIGRRVYHPDYWNFEDRGNYIYALSKREIEKVALGLQLPLVAFYYFNDYYEKGVEFEKISNQSKLFGKVKRKIRIRDVKCKLGWLNYNMIVAILFKIQPTKDVCFDLEKAGFVLNALPLNPQLKDLLPTIDNDD